MSRMEQPTFPLRMTHAQRRCVAELLAHLEPKLLLDCGNQRTLQFTLEEIRQIARACQEALPKAPNGMKRNSLWHVVDVSERALEAFREGKIQRIPAATLYQFKITLKDIRPPVWRRIQVKDCSLDRLHAHIQTAMGWTNSHLHQFKIDGVLYGDPDLICESWEDETWPVNSLETKVSMILPEDGAQMQFEYKYDFGDGWEHEILFEGCLSPKRGSRYPVCVDGQRACPPEDVGGTFGYEAYLAILADPNHEEHESYMEWRGTFDPEAFDSDAASRRMRRGLPDWRTMW